jgi:hypothetical protein
MTWKFNPFTQNFDYYEGYDVVNHNVDANLTLADLRQVHMMDVSGGLRNIYLPVVGTDNIGEWVILVRSGVANPLRIWANGTDIIYNSSPGGYIECDDAGHDYSSQLLVVIADGVWGNPSFGIWTTY